jgi:hypothetical protein
VVTRPPCLFAFALLDRHSHLTSPRIFFNRGFVAVGRIRQQDSAERAFNKQGGGEQTMPRGIATARGGQWTAVQVGSILKRAENTFSDSEQ